MPLSNQQQRCSSRRLPTCCPAFARGMAPQKKALPPGPARIPAGLLSCCPYTSVEHTTGCEHGAINFALLLEAAATSGSGGNMQATTNRGNNATQSLTAACKQYLPAPCR